MLGLRAEDDAEKKDLLLHILIFFLKIDASNSLKNLCDLANKLPQGLFFLLHVQSQPLLIEMDAYHVLLVIIVLLCRNIQVLNYYKYKQKNHGMD